MSWLFLVCRYDAITVKGELDWQNKLNKYNKPFFDLCDGLFANYTWKVTLFSLLFTPVSPLMGWWNLHDMCRKKIRRIQLQLLETENMMSTWVLMSLDEILLVAANGLSDCMHNNLCFYSIYLDAPLLLLTNNKYLQHKLISDDFSV